MELQLIQNKIYDVRGRRVMLDFDLAELYGVETRVLKQSVRRNIERFEGEDFMFELMPEEYNRLITRLRSQFVILETDDDMRGRHAKYMPFAFTEIGVAMLSSVLRSPAAIYANRAIMRAFVAMRDYIASTSSITAELKAIRSSIEALKCADEETIGAVNNLSEYTREEIYGIWDAITILSEKSSKTDKPRNPIGYKTTAKIQE